jgi:hypothetical protein
LILSSFFVFVKPAAKRRGICERGLLAELNGAGFYDNALYADAAGGSYVKNEDTIAVVATKTK